MVTPLNKYIGYEEAARVAKKALAERKTIRQVVVEGGYVERGDLTAEQLDEALDVLRMTHPDRRAAPTGRRPSCPRALPAITGASGGRGP